MKQNLKVWARGLVTAAAALCLLAAAALPAVAAPELNPDTAVNDYAGILSEQTEDYVESLSVALQNTCGAQIGVYTTEYIGNSTMEGYAYDVLNTWGLGSADKDNGVLLLLVPGEDDYYVTRGAGLESQLTISMLGTILDEDLEPNWVLGDYDTGTQKTVRAIAEELCSIYGIPTSTLDTAGQAAAPAPRQEGMSPVTVVLILFAVLLVIIVLVNLSHPRGPGPRPPRGGGGGWGNALFWYGLGRASRPRRPRLPPPPPGGFGPGPGGFGPGGFGPRPGGFGGPRPGGFGGPRPGGFGGPRPGGFRPGGGSSRGGGVGRRH